MGEPSDNKEQGARLERAAEDVAARVEAVGRALEEARRVDLAAVAAAAVAHEVRNLLTPVRARMEMALGGAGDRAFVEGCLRSALVGVDRAARAAEAVLGVLAGRRDGEVADVAAAVAVAAGWVRGGGFEVEERATGNVGMSAVALEQVVLNLLLNARAAVSGRGMVVVRTVVDVGRSKVKVEVEDRRRSGGYRTFGPNGNETCKGVPSPAPSLGEGGSTHPPPPPSGRGGALACARGSDRRGAGVGLVICRHLVEAVGGAMGVRAGAGTVVWVELPMAQRGSLTTEAQRRGEGGMAAA